ncbi:aquaporin-like isoform X2 [Bacillus rossius redtenbacheri]|uniref:aquaporin-like isoform X2 n=1 Tax=Bacillus rossius redtenbacheri TaxID=93214 RepID=UPI002FDE694D
MARGSRENSAGDQAGVLDMSAFSGDGRWVVARKGLAELMGTALLLFLGCMGGVGGLSESPPPHLQVALTFGLVVGIIIQIIGHITDAHLNPAVTAAAVILDRMTLPVSAVYVLSQLAGGVLGYGMLLVVTPRSALEAAAPNGSRCALCVTLPHAELSAPQAVLAEALVTAVLILVVCSVWDPRNAANTDSVPLKFGFTVAAIAAAEGPYTGASMNPARSLGPVIWTGVWSYHWVYWVGPMLGAVVAAYTYKLVWGVPAPRGPAEVTEESLPLRDVRNSKEVEARASATNLSSA